jgi:hypothetical protein
MHQLQPKIAEKQQQIKIMLHKLRRLLPPLRLI